MSRIVGYATDIPIQHPTEKFKYEVWDDAFELEPEFALVQWFIGPPKAEVFIYRDRMGCRKVGRKVSDTTFVDISGSKIKVESITYWCELPEFRGGYGSK